MSAISKAEKGSGGGFSFRKRTKEEGGKTLRQQRKCMQEDRGAGRKQKGEGLHVQIFTRTVEGEDYNKEEGGETLLKRHDLKNFQTNQKRGRNPVARQWG